MKLLVVEDEASIAEVVIAYAKREGYETVYASDGLSALEIFADDDIDLVVLDLMLPKLNGEEVCRRIREKSSVPIIMLTAKSSESDVVEGLDLGANDYVAKPFSPRVLMARIRTQLRTKETRDSISAGVCADGRIEIDPERVELRKDGVVIPVTRSEFLIFSTLASRPIRTWSREEIIRSALGEDYDGFDRTIDTYVKNLRKKLAEPGHENGWIKTIYGFGYRFDDEK
ncbi:MAG: response regulator transcription factor [Synergistaceae bacterium]|nr:response regulator transcription factor [Synergistaceae bacterium]MBR0035438.1 response regulator transcription factor [Synergistaceae bacterium]